MGSRGHGGRGAGRVRRSPGSRPTRWPAAGRASWAAAVLVAAVAAGGCSPASSGSGAGQPTVASTSTSTAPPHAAPPAPPTSAPPTTSISTSTAAARLGADASARGALPIPSRTPGALDATVTPADIRATICVVGWTATVRPPESYTEPLKIRQLDTGYAFRGDQRLGDYEEDHLVPLELGGSPRSVRNLWPEPYHLAAGARVKDRVEDRLHALVCDGRVPLRTAQHAMATDWETAYRRWVGPLPVAPPTTFPPATFPPATAPPGSGAGPTCRASVSDARPSDYSTVEVTVDTGVAGASVIATAHYRTTDTSHSVAAGSSGVARVAFDISGATRGYQVNVGVEVRAGGASASCRTSFIPQ